MTGLICFLQSQGNTTIVELLLAGNKVSEDCLNAMEALLERNRRNPQAAAPSTPSKDSWHGTSPQASPTKRSAAEASSPGGPVIRSLGMGAGAGMTTHIRSVLDESSPDRPPRGGGSGGEYDYEALEQTFRDKMMEMSNALMQVSCSFGGVLAGLGMGVVPLVCIPGKLLRGS